MTQMKTPFDIFLIKDFTKPTKADYIAYLKKHEQEMTDYVKAQNPKVKSVQFDWDSVESEVVGNGTPQGGENILSLRINIFDSKNVKINAFGFAVEPDNISKPDVIKDMYTINANYDYFEVK
ncbi:hypothetical protein Hs30E_18350 [Lactococcus hodotermopsidis]|uniref:Uncharacterized protein n=1 Tax=Pseudolactococcus hodotermopsidis TaxID=2709157 RepID=A0A6A0BFM5_9LACT|nr:hypothetical protein [Lactococcus hodotermopsidis]GFH43284.1 hypothetical protein Hs30E_18350 [Lactococcus hodotermopsidis]